jgi:signal transduction histidine kinase
VALGRLVDEVIADLTFDPNLDIRMGVGDLPEIEANPELLRRVFLNLITNAVKYSDKKTIIINVGTERVYENALGKFCELYVEDNGPGIPAEEHTEIFSMFRRGASSEHEAEGLGIGLSVVQKIVELHFGSISIQSDPSWGTKFLISLPMEKIDFIS